MKRDYLVIITGDENDADYVHKIMKATKEEADFIISSYNKTVQFHKEHEKQYCTEWRKKSLSYVHTLLDSYKDYESLVEDNPWIKDSFSEDDIFKVWSFLESYIPWGQEEMVHSLTKIEVFKIENYYLNYE